MCGFVGIINKNGNVPDYRILKQMASKIHHRGPDDEGHFIDGNIGFYHKRLSIIDLKTGRQPMSKNGVTIVFNGEIYNFIELRDKLKKEGHQFDTTSDTEVILSSYLQYGLDFINELNGMFAFLVYDRAKNRILAARDRFGIKPLYYYIGKEGIIFGSEIKAFLAHPDIKPEPDYDSIQDYITFQFVLNGNTFFKQIHELLPGQYQLIDIKSLKTQSVKYWEPDFTVDTHHTEEYFIAKLRELLKDTVRIQMRSDVPLGTHLSGGIDSSLITMLAARDYPAQLKTFTGAFNNGAQFNETDYAREVARICRAEIFEVYPTEKEFVEFLPKLIYHMDEPCAGPGLFPQYMVAKLAADKVKVVLGGQGGDEIFGGYARFVIAYLEQAIKGSIFETTEEGEHIVSLKTILPNLPTLKRYVPMLRRFWKVGLFEAMDRRYFHLIDRGNGDLDTFSKDFRNSFDREKIFSRFHKMFNHPQTLSYYNKMVHFEMVASLPALLHVEDRVSMAASLESRVPLLDHRVVELITRMPPAMKFKGAEMKYILKRSFSDVLPEKIINRQDKMGFPVPLHIWAKNGAREFIRDILLSPACRSRGLFDTSRVEELIENEEEFGRLLWGLLNIELWFRTFIDKA